LRLALRKLGFAVEIFTDPELALRRIDEKRFDIVITDVVMGDIDGIHVLDRALRKSSATKVIIITAFATREVAHKAMARGAFGFIAKPFDSGEIRSIVTRAADSLGEEVARS
jgi:DNA-binding NtrC family response regulator